MMIIDTRHTIFSRLDNFFDKVPVASSVTNLIDIFLKCVPLRFVSEATTLKSHYIRHLKEKSFFRCFILLIPGVGNLLVVLYDLINSRKADKHLKLAEGHFEGTESEKEEALKNLRIAADRGNAQALSALGNKHLEGDEVKRDPNQAIKLHIKAIDKGNSLSEYSLGAMFETGDGVEKSPSEAFRWYLRAALHGQEGAMHTVGLCYIDGEGIGKDEKKALEWFKRAADKGVVPSFFEMGDIYKNGSEGIRDEKLAAEYYALGAEKGDNDAKYELGLCCLAGKGVPKDEKKAFSYIKEAADDENGLDVAVHKTGSMFLEGCGVERNLTQASNYFNLSKTVSAEDLLKLGKALLSDDTVQDKEVAFTWIKEAAEMNHVEALKIAGNMYLRGFGVDKIPAKGIESLTKAANLGDTESMAILSGYYFEEGEDKNEQTGFEWSLKASNAGHLNSYQRTGDLYQRGIGVDKNEELAYQTFLAGAVREESKSMYFLAYCFLEGCFVSIDKKEAFKWFEKSAKAGHLKSYLDMGLMYLAGEGVEQSNDKAYTCFKEAAKVDIDALNMLGSCYLNGIGTGINHKMASECFQKASEAGQLNAKFNLASMCLHGLVEGKTVTNAIELFTESANQGCVDSKLLLGAKLCDGIEGFLPQDMARGMKYLEEAAESSNCTAMEKLGLLHLIPNTHHPRDIEKAKKWFNKAADLGSALAKSELERIARNEYRDLPLPINLPQSSPSPRKRREQTRLVTDEVKQAINEQSVAGSVPFLSPSPSKRRKATST